MATAEKKYNSLYTHTHRHTHTHTHTHTNKHTHTHTHTQTHKHTNTVTEPYYLRVFSKKYRSALAKFRCGVALLHIHSGRYRNIPEESRVCFQCPDKMENELHVIIQCELYTDLRVSLFESATNICSDFLNMNDSDNLCFLLSNDKIGIDVARTLHDILEKRRQFYM